MRDIGGFVRKVRVCHRSSGWVAVAALSALLLPIGTAQVAAAAAPTPGLAKSYTGSANNLTASESGAITLSQVTQTGGAISGTFNFQSPLAGTGPFKGTVSAKSIKFTVTPTARSCPSCTSIAFSGTVSAIVSFSGTWVAHLKSGPPQKGTWHAGSTWFGTLSGGPVSDPDAAQGVHITLGPLFESANGTIVGTYYEYYQGTSTSPLIGSIHGTVVKFTLPPSDGYTYNYTGTLTGSEAMSGTWVNPNDGAKGTWQVRRSAGAVTAV
jgi:hypothetical protein